MIRKKQPILLTKLPHKKPAKRAPFLVAYISTVTDQNGLQIPYAIGLLLVDSDTFLDRKCVQTWFSEDYLHENDFQTRSTCIMNEFLDSVFSLVMQIYNLHANIQSTCCVFS